MSWLWQPHQYGGIIVDIRVRTILTCDCICMRCSYQQHNYIAFSNRAMAYLKLHDNDRAEVGLTHVCHFVWDNSFFAFSPATLYLRVVADGLYVRPAHRAVSYEEPPATSHCSECSGQAQGRSGRLEGSLGSRTHEVRVLPSVLLCMVWCTSTIGYRIFIYNGIRNVPLQQTSAPRAQEDFGPHQECCESCPSGASDYAVGQWRRRGRWRADISSR